MKKMIVTSVLLTTVLGAVPALASAEPADAAVHFSTTATEKSTQISLDSGAIVVDRGVLAIRSANGTTVAGTELSFRVDDFVFPITAEVKDRTATLTPRFDAENALGTLTGQLLVTAPVAIMAAVQYFTTITQPAPSPAPAPAK
ncbi:hypothetical protein [Nocardia salmonicida]|uniref:hypothetical protein n=1 Tax=Nocardia salmonicida TaxID=53431 RepID=UPI002E281674|nr:hypothetical protein [Nocardia salmonicida]